MSDWCNKLEELLIMFFFFSSGTHNLAHTHIYALTNLETRAVSDGYRKRGCGVGREDRSGLGRRGKWRVGVEGR